MLLQTEKADELQTALTKVIEQAGPAPVTDQDQAGRLHEVWSISDPAAVAELTLWLAAATWS
ncbi:hypothetical protein [Ornithinimicrobium sp. INDO-MA30-4]|uniref:hypothetical protein n=1 Tax=Ornithinimicrobium sp. INDO-MA30-4 TaxID=2908651 RepID=UPI001F3A8FDD|nr:hypothetical protein [Ornithinimicrobium sp. INDO-MA30-4]UJH70864.1 hypothetical protein L0A91_02360 [Ornithinimicrobium sp. INDO-MA30-4]